MSGLTNTYEQELADYWLGAQAMTSAPATWYIGLYTTMPADDGTGGVEVTGGSYARKSVANNLTQFPAATGGAPTTKSNANEQAFTTATADWGTIVGWGLFSASTGGSPYIIGTLTASVLIQNTDQFKIAAGDLKLEVGDDGDTFT